MKFLDQIILSDCLKILPQMPKNSIDMVFMDPPYGHNNNNGDLISRWDGALGKFSHTSESNRPIMNDGLEANDFFQAVLPELHRVLKPGAVICCCCGGGGGPDPQFARWSLWLDQVFQFKQMVVWDKGAPGVNRPGLGWHYRRSYETILVAQKQGAACKWYDTTHRVENVIRHVKKLLLTKDHHPTEKPIALAQIFIRLHTLPGEVVLDPFAGAGSTLVAAKSLQRHWIGIELDPHWHAVACKKVNETSVNLSLWEP